jgi:hypothetical protein
MANAVPGATRVKGMSVFSRPVLSRAGRSPNSGAGRLALAAAAFVCVAAAAAGCSSSGTGTASAPASTVTVTATPSAPAASSSAPAASPGISPHVAGAPACPTSSLQVKPGVGQGYAGGTYEVIDFTNTSNTSCTLYGYPGVSLVSGSPYAQIGQAAKRSTTTPVKLVTLAPGATANALLQIVDALNFPTSSCSPTPATALRIYPPNQTAPVYIPTTAQGCASSSQVLFINAVAPGAGSSNT